MLLLNTKKRITYGAMIYRGTVNAIYIRPAELFKEAVQVNAPVLLLSHYYPSESAEPSRLAQFYNLLKEALEDNQAIAVADLAQTAMVGHRLIEVVANVPAMC